MLGAPVSNPITLLWPGCLSRETLAFSIDPALVLTGPGHSLLGAQGAPTRLCSQDRPRRCPAWPRLLAQPTELPPLLPRPGALVWGLPLRPLLRVEEPPPSSPLCWAQGGGEGREVPSASGPQGQIRCLRGHRDNCAPGPRRCSPSPIPQHSHTGLTFPPLLDSRLFPSDVRGKAVEKLV